MADIVHAVGMNILAGPMTSYSNIPGNEGITSIVTLDFSHAAIHIWPLYNKPLIEFDLFSCKHFEIDTVLDRLRQFDLLQYNIVLFDRDNNFNILTQEQYV
jgi:S-adenosylmethionine/arginine decarboxylase-like enzyme